MAGTPFSELVDLFTDQLERSGATVLRSSGRVKSPPARLRVVTGNATTDCIVYLRTITHGGKKRRANEQRIQVTGIERFPLEPGRRTIVGGWNPDLTTWAFWDPRRHTKFSKLGSSSFQTTQETLELAERIGIATQFRSLKEGQEVIVAVSPTSLLWYVESGEALHATEDDSVGVSLLAEPSRDTADEERNFIEEAQTESQFLRRTEIVTYMRLFRDAKFKPAVLQAYRYKCAVCQCALKLVDAAHIVPVSYPQSTDDVTNGLALCRLHHGAYDNGLLGVKSDCSIILNPDSESRLAELNLDMGLPEFKSRLPAKIVVPHSIEARPDPQKLILGLKARYWPTILCA